MPHSSRGPFSFKHLATGSALYGASDVVVALVRFSLIALYTRILSPAEFGLFSIIFTTLTLAVVFIPIGIPSAFMLRLHPNDSPESKACKDEAFMFLFQVCLAGGAVFYVLSAMFFSKTILLTLALWLTLHMTGEILSMIPKASLRFKEKITAFSTAKVVRVICMILLLLVLLDARVGGLKAVIIAESVAALAECLLCMALDGYVPSRLSFSCIWSMLGVGAPLMLIGVGVFCIDLSDRYVVYLLLGQQANGYYAAAGKVALAASFFAEAFNSMWFPYYLRIGPKNGAAIPENLKRFASKLVVLFSIAISLLMLALPALVKVRIFGSYFIAPQYHVVAALVAPLTLAYFFKSAFYMSSAIIIANGKSWALARSVYIAAFVNIGADVLWATLPYGAGQFSTLTAIALMTSVSYAICMVLVSASSGLFPVRYWVTSGEVLLCAAALCLSFLPMPVAARYSVWTACAVIAASLYFSKRKKAGTITL
jgi:O-antigen/teichoic acid export membrane protein